MAPALVSCPPPRKRQHSPSFDLFSAPTTGPGTPSTRPPRGPGHGSSAPQHPPSRHLSKLDALSFSSWVPTPRLTQQVLLFTLRECFLHVYPGGKGGHSVRTGPKPPEANLAAPGERSAHGTAQDGTKEAQRKDASAGDGESGPSRFLIGLEVKLQKKKKKLKNTALV